MNIRVTVSMLIIASIFLASCGDAAPTPTPTPKLKVGVLIDTGTQNDKGFNQYTVEGAQRAAQATGLDFSFSAPESAGDYEKQIDKMAAAGANLIITVGFRMGNATEKAAKSYPNTRFAIVDTAFTPGNGCAASVKDCYSKDGGLFNVTSLLFSEDQASYPAGVLAACMSKTGTIAAVLGIDIPPVERYAKGYQNGAQSFNPTIKVLTRYIPDFNDPPTGKITAQDFMRQGADVVFAAAGNTGNGALQAAKDAGVMAIGVDVDQYLSYPEVSSTLITSAVKNVDVAAEGAVKDFAAGKLEAGIRLATLSNAGVGLAPYHDWDNKISQTCKDKVKAAQAAIVADPKITGVE